MSKRDIYRVLENGEEAWRGKAFDADHALERYADYCDGAGSLVDLKLEKLGTVNLTKSGSHKGEAWSKVWEGRLTD